VAQQGRVNVKVCAGAVEKSGPLPRVLVTGRRDGDAGGVDSVVVGVVRVLLPVNI